MTKHILFLVVSFLSFSVVAANENREIPVIQVTSVWDYNRLQKIKSSLNGKTYSKAYLSLKNKADSIMLLKPLSVMDKKTTPASGSKHDYMSIGRYSWPNPSTADGMPYITKDGQVNPELFEYDRYPLGTTVERVVILSMMWYFSDDEKYAEKATEFLRVWFLNENSKMNPNLNYSQVIMGKNGNKGRSIGIIDTYSFVEMLEAVKLLEKSKSFTNDECDKLKRWFKEFLDWLLHSDFGVEESKMQNNHGSAYDIQIIAFSLFSGEKEISERYLKEFYRKRILKQVLKNGEQPLELKRTLGFHYSRENITHYINALLLSKRLNINMIPKGENDLGLISSAIDFLLPYVNDGGISWPFRQISGWDTEIQMFCKDLYRVYHLLHDNEVYIDTFYKHYKKDNKDRFVLLY